MSLTRVSEELVSSWQIKRLTGKIPGNMRRLSKNKLGNQVKKKNSLIGKEINLEALTI